MAQLAEFLLNLLFLRRKFLTNRAAEVIHEAVQKCLSYKRKILIEYNNTMHMVGPFENMLDFVNYSASHYTGQGGNYVVTREIRVCEELDKTMHQEIKHTEVNKKNKEVNYSVELVNEAINPERASHRKSKKTERTQSFNTYHKSCRHRHEDSHNQKKQKCQDYIIDNLHAMLKSQEFLFKNIIKLVNILEKDATLDVNAKRLKKVKSKLVACRDVLSGTNDFQNYSTIINNIIEEEITRCKFRHGEAKTSAEINLKKPKPEGIAIVLQTPTQSHVQKSIKPKIRSERKNEVLKLSAIDSEIKKHSKNLLKRTKSKIKPERKNAVLRRGAIESEIEIHSKNLLKRTRSEFKSERKNEVLSRGAIESEIKTHSKNLLKRTNSEPLINLWKTKEQNSKFDNNKEIKTESSIKTDSMTDSNKLIEINEKHFHQVDDELWHSLTTLKYISLKEDYLNNTKSAFHNKRQFLAMESALSRQLRLQKENKTFEKFLSISESMFQITERKLIFDELKEKMKSMDKTPLEFMEEIARANKSLQSITSKHCPPPTSEKNNVAITEASGSMGKPKFGEYNEISNFQKVLATLRKNISSPKEAPKLIASKEPTQQAFKSGHKINTKQGENLQKKIQKTSSVFMIGKKSNATMQNKILEKRMNETPQLQNKDLVKTAPKKMEDKFQKIELMNPTCIETQKRKDEMALNKNIKLNKTLTIVNEIKIINDNGKSKTISKIKEMKSRQFGNCQPLMKKDENQNVSTKKESINKQASPLEKKPKLKIQDECDKLCKDEKLKEYKVSKSQLKLITQGPSIGIRKEPLTPSIGIRQDNCIDLNKAISLVDKKEDKSKVKCISVEQLKNEADLIAMNQKIFDEMENTLHTVQNFGEIEGAPAEKLTNLKTSTKNNNKDPIKKEMSTQASTITRDSIHNFNRIFKSKPDILYKGDKEESHPSPRPNKTFIRAKGNIQVKKSQKTKMDNSKQRFEKDKTFLKSASHQCILNRDLLLNKIVKKSEHACPRPVSDTIIHKKSIHMRRTTKSVMKRQQVLTTLPKRSKFDIRVRTKSKVSTSENKNKTIKDNSEIVKA